MALLETERQELRQLIKAQIDAAEASKRSADEASSSAKYAKQMVFWMAASVVVLALASVASFMLDLLTFLQRPGGG